MNVRRRHLVVAALLRCLSTSSSRKLVLPRESSVVWLKASDVAACIGKNQFKPRGELLAEMHKRYSAETFTGQTKLDIALEAVDRLPAMERRMLLQAASMQLTKAAEVKAVLGEVSETIKQSSKVSDKDKEAVVSLLTGTMQTNLGTRTEDLIVKSVETEQRVKMERSTDMYSLPLVRVGGTQYAVRGKIDRLQQEGDETILIEIKSRVNKLFRKLRDYEEVQVQTYLQMLPPEMGVKRARLIEQFETQSHSLELVKDDALWQKEIFPGLVRFCQELDQVMRGGGAAR